MRARNRVLVSVVIAACGATASAGSADAMTVNVGPGQSIQAAIDAASPGDVIRVHPGTYRESLQISKDGITLAGERATLRPPTEPANTLCNQQGPPTGICVVGQLQFGEGPPTVVQPVKNTVISGFRIEGFGGDGIFGFGSEGMRVQDTRMLHNGGYGVFSNTSSGTRFEGNVSEGNGDAGFYVGDSQPANAVVRNNRSTGNSGEGIFLRDASHGSVSGNEMAGNCSGIVVLADAPGPAEDWKIRSNRVNENNRACAGDPEEGEDPTSGIGIALVGARHVLVVKNTVNGNRDLHPSAASGGILVVSGPGGTTPTGDTIRENSAFGNTPFDLVWDGTGSPTFSSNQCGTSNPAGLCSG